MCNIVFCIILSVHACICILYRYVYFVYLINSLILTDSLGIISLTCFLLGMQWAQCCMWVELQKQERRFSLWMTCHNWFLLCVFCRQVELTHFNNSSPFDNTEQSLNSYFHSSGYIHFQITNLTHSNWEIYFSLCYTILVS